MGCTLNKRHLPFDDLDQGLLGRSLGQRLQEVGAQLAQRLRVMGRDDASGNLEQFLDLLLGGPGPKAGKVGFEVR